MAKYRGLAPWALGIAALAHACAGVTELADGDEEPHSSSSANAARGVLTAASSDANVIGALRLKDGVLIIRSELGGVRYAFQAPGGAPAASLTIDELRQHAPELYETVRTATAAAGTFLDARVDPASTVHTAQTPALLVEHTR